MGSMHSNHIEPFGPHHGEPHIPHTPYDWWRDGNVRYAGYANELGEAFRPLIPKPAVAATYVVAIGYAAGDTFDKGQREYRRSRNVNHSVAAGSIAALWQLLASVTIPALFVNRQVALTAWLLKRSSSRMATTFGPTLSGLCMIPFLPYILDPPITHVVNEAALWAGITPTEP
ncbi:Mitochondrial fission process protein 1 [Diplonema papillatum]|nr:Mitochondrial fission process protein 1 [Diplonema papillatum]|eukprot:gene16119-24694_t